MTRGLGAVVAAAVAGWLLMGSGGGAGIGPRQRLERLGAAASGRTARSGAGRPSDRRRVSTRSWLVRFDRPASDPPHSAADPALFVDLVAAGLAAGASVTESVLAVTRALPGQLAVRLEPVCAALALGAEPTVAWAPLRSDPRLRPVAAALTRAAGSGAPAADALLELAADLRARRAVAAARAARIAGVRAVAPLGLCFLPAFVLLGVVPTVIGLASAALSHSPS